MTTNPNPDPRVKHLRDAQRRVRSALIANADRLSTPFTDDPGKNPWDTFVRPAMRELKAAVDAVAVSSAVSVVPPATNQTAPVDRAAVLRDFLWRLEQSAGDAAAEKLLDDNPELRRLAAEAPHTATPAFETARDSKASPKADSKPETVHACPPDGFGLTPCCGRTPFELPRTDRISSEAAAVTCAPAVVAQPGKEN